MTCIATIIGVAFKCYRHRKNKSQDGMPAMPYQTVVNAPQHYQPPAPAQPFHPGAPGGTIRLELNFNEAGAYMANGGYRNGGMTREV